MAYAPDPNDQNSPQQLTGQPMNQPPATSSGAGANSSGAGAPQGSTAVPASTQAPPVQNLQAYLTANAPQSVQMGQNIASNLNQTANQVTGDINSAQNTINGQVQQSNIAPNSDLVNRAATDPSSFVQNADDVKAFQQQRDANYTGPTSFESTPYSQSLMTEVKNAQQQAPDITKPEGVQQLARGQEQNPTTGMSNLDALLLQESPGALAPVQEAIPQFAKLSDVLSGAQNSTDAAIQKAIQNDQAAKAGVQTTFLTGSNAVVPAWQKALQDEVTQAQGKADTYNQSVQDVIAKENAMQSILADTENSISGYNNQTYNPANLGISADSKLVPMNYDLSGLSKAPTTLGAATPGSVASTKDYATEAALNQLLGINLTNLNQADASKAGSYNVPENAGLDTKGAIAGLQGELDAANKGFTNNGALQYQGTPAGSIITNSDIPPGYTVIPQSDLSHGSVKGQIDLGQGDRFGTNYVAVPIGSVLPNGKTVGATPTFGLHNDQTNVTGVNTADTGNTFPSDHGGASSQLMSLSAPAYYSNAQLSGANKQISDLIKYLQGIS